MSQEAVAYVAKLDRSYGSRFERGEYSISFQPKASVDGRFWHGCPKHCRVPASNREYWERKIAKNKMRDKTVTHELRKAGWTVLRVWEHSLKDFPARVISRIRKALQAG